MSGYASVPPSMYDDTFCRLSPDAQRLEFYIRTCPQRSSEGLFRLKFGAIEDDTGIDRETAREALRELEESGRPFMYDEKAGVILDTDALATQPLGKKKSDPGDWNGVENAERRIKGAIKNLKALPRTSLLKHLLVVADIHSPQLGKAMRDEFDLPEMDTDDYSAIGEAPSQAPYQAPSVAPYQAASRAEQSRDEESREEGTVQRISKAFPGSEVLRVNP